MLIKNENQIKYMRISGHILSKIIKELVKYTKVGITTQQIDLKAQELMKKYKVISAFKNFNGYPAVTCISINEEIVHGLPSNKVIKDGDVVSIDCGVKYKGYCSDSAITFTIGEVSDKIKKLVKVTRKSLDESIKLIRPGIKIGDIQARIQSEIENNNLGLVRELTGHGIGKFLQEEPQIPNYGRLNTGITLKPGMTFCLEPMVTLGNGKIKIKNDGWTITSQDNTIAAHFEHTINVTKNGYEILTK